jgi:hypothetical protein
MGGAITDGVRSFSDGMLDLRMGCKNARVMRSVCTCDVFELPPLGKSSVTVTVPRRGPFRVRFSAFGREFPVVLALYRRQIVQHFIQPDFIRLRAFHPSAAAMGRPAAAEAAAGAVRVHPCSAVFELPPLGKSSVTVITSRRGPFHVRFGAFAPEFPVVLALYRR